MGDVQRPVPVTLERIRVREAGRDHGDRAGRDTHAIHAAAAEVAVVVGDVDLSIDEELAQKRVPRGDRYHAGDLTGSVDYADVAGEAGRVQGSASVGGDAFGVVAVCGSEIGEVLNDALPERPRDDRLRRYESEYRDESDSPAAHLILPKSDPDRPREMLNPHERKHILGEALHLFSLRARLQQQQVKIGRAHV